MSSADVGVSFALLERNALNHPIAVGCSDVLEEAERDVAPCGKP